MGEYLLRLFLTWQLALFLTLTIETLLAAIVGIGELNDFKVVLFVNVLTNPLVNIVHYIAVILCGLPSVPIIIALELWAFLFEGFLYTRMLRFRGMPPYLLSLLLNLSSYGLGLLIFR